MPRIARKDLKMPYNHVIVQGINKEYVFNSDKLKDKYRNLIKENIRENEEIKSIAYCVMGNHAHMLFYTEDIKEISKLMHSVNTSYAQYYNKLKNRVGVVFRNRYYIQPIYSEKQLYNCLVYIHNNPVKAGIVNAPEEYKYSSYNEWINKKEIIDEQAPQLIYGDRLLNKEEFRENHFNNEILDIEDVADIVDYNIIIKKYEIEANKKLDELVKNQEILCRLIESLRKESRLSVRRISEILGINRPKVTKIVKQFGV